MPHSRPAGASHHQRPETRVLAGHHGARAGRATDRREAALVQRVRGYVVRADVTPDVVLAPVRQRRELHEAVLRIVRENRRVRARDRLVAAQARDPQSLAGQRAGQRPDLAQFAASLAQFHRMVESVRAVRGDERFDGRRVRRVEAHRPAVALAHGVDERVGFVVQPTGVERENLDGQVVRGDEVEDHHVLDAEAGRQCRRRVRGHCVSQSLGGFSCAQGQIHVGRFPKSERGDAKALLRNPTPHTR